MQGVGAGDRKVLLPTRSDRKIRRHFTYLSPQSERFPSGIHELTGILYRIRMILTRNARQRSSGFVGAAKPCCKIEKL